MSNSFANSFIERANEIFSQDSVDMPMSEWISKNTTIRNRPFNYKGYEFQKQIVDDLHPDLCCIKVSQVGMALDLNTPIPTPSGWATMGELSVGDKVYSENGEPVEVTYVSPVYTDHRCYEIEFDDGTKIVSDENHKWYVEAACGGAFNEGGLYAKSGRIPKNSGFSRTGVILTKTMAEVYYRNGRNLFAIPNTKPLYGGGELAVNPYYLGLWLGDGHSYSTNITGHQDDTLVVKKLLHDRGLVTNTVELSGSTETFKVEIAGTKRGNTLYSEMVKLNVIKNKHIPNNYLRASVNDRLELLRGLLDTDGSIAKNGRCYFYNTNPLLVAGVTELLHSLGFKARTRWREPTKPTGKAPSGLVINSKKRCAEVSFVAYADNPVFNLPRKKNRLRDKTVSRPTEVGRRRIVSIKEVNTRPVRCISVDSPAHLYLAGTSMVPTHNTEIQIRKALAFLTRNNGTSLIFSLPTEEMFQRVSNSRVKPIINKDKVFLTQQDKEAKAVRSVGMMQFGQSFLYLVPAIESAATSIPADVIFNDELDLSDQQIVSLFNSRLQNSKYRISQRFGTPSFPSFGIDLEWQASDQNLYMCKCQHCNHWQHPEFNRSFIYLPGLPDKELTEVTADFADALQFEKGYIMCEKCHKPLDLGNPENRQWVAKYPSRIHKRGYRIGPFSTPRLDTRYIYKSLWDYQKNEYVRGFYNTVLGLPYSDGNIQIPEEDILACMTSDSVSPALTGKLWVGIDMGQICHITIGRGETEADLEILSMYQVHVRDIVSHCKMLVDNYNVAGGAVDRHPYEPTAREIFNITNSKIIPVEYRGSKDINLVYDSFEELSHAQVNPTWFLDNFASKIRKRALKISGYGIQKRVVIEQYRDMVREEKPGEPAKWTKLTGNDHYLHSSAFMCVSPKIRDIYNYTGEEENRIILMSQVVKQPNSTGTNLIGLSNKSVVKPSTTVHSILR